MAPRQHQHASDQAEGIEQLTRCHSHRTCASHCLRKPTQNHTQGTVTPSRQTYALSSMVQASHVECTHLPLLVCRSLAVACGAEYPCPQDSLSRPCLRPLKKTRWHGIQITALWLVHGCDIITARFEKQQKAYWHITSKAERKRKVQMSMSPHQTTAHQLHQWSCGPVSPGQLQPPLLGW